LASVRVRHSLRSFAVFGRLPFVGLLASLVRGL
jgi:hypothetical protein